MAAVRLEPYAARKTDDDLPTRSLLDRIRRSRSLFWTSSDQYARWLIEAGVAVNDAERYAAIIEKKRRQWDSFFNELDLLTAAGEDIEVNPARYRLIRLAKDKAEKTEAELIEQLRDEMNERDFAALLKVLMMKGGRYMWTHPLIVDFLDLDESQVRKIRSLEAKQQQVLDQALHGKEFGELRQAASSVAPQLHAVYLEHLDVLTLEQLDKRLVATGKKHQGQSWRSWLSSLPTDRREAYTRHLSKLPENAGTRP